jgi:hypothetical protein
MKQLPAHSLFPALAILVTTAACADSGKRFTPTPAAGEVKALTLKVAGQEFAQLLYAGCPKPVIHGIRGPGGLEMTRQWPIKPAADGEEQDHPHHQGLWFTHGDVNGIDFWAITDKSGYIEVQGTPSLEEKDGTTTVTSKEVWKDHGGKPVCTSQTTIVCGADGADDRYIDYSITLHASEGDVVLGDTKEGTMAIRTRPELNLKGKVAKGQAQNSEGESGKDIWGKKARWVDYYAPVDGKTVGVALFDHPSNLRHPTFWHARDYGLIAANPFGLHDFEKKEKGAGDHKIAKGQSLTFKYRWLFHTGDTAAAKIPVRYGAWAGAK